MAYMGLGTSYAPHGSFLGDFCHAPGCSFFWGSSHLSQRALLLEIPLRTSVQCATWQRRHRAWARSLKDCSLGPGAWSPGQGVLSFLSPLLSCCSENTDTGSVPLATCTLSPTGASVSLQIPRVAFRKGPSEPSQLACSLLPGPCHPHRPCFISFESCKFLLPSFWPYFAWEAGSPRLVPIMQSSACWINFLFHIDSSFLHK